MWSPVARIQPIPPAPGKPHRDKLLTARSRMQEALTLLDESSSSAAAASLDMAIHQLNRELS